MKRKSLKLLALVTVACMLLSALAACSQTPAPTAAPTTAPASAAAATEAPTPAAAETATPAPAPTQKPIVTIASIFPGTQPASQDAVLAAINTKMGEEAGVNLDLTWAPWDQYQNKFTLAIQAGEKIDFVWYGTSNLVQLATDKLIAPIDDSMAKYGAPIYAVEDKQIFEGMKIGGKLMGIPSTTNGPLVGIYHDLIYREDLRLKYNLPALTSIDNIDLYLKTIKEKEPTMTPISGNYIAWTIGIAFSSDDGIGGTNGIIRGAFNDDGTVTCMPFYEAKNWTSAAQKVREWYNAGYIPQDILNTGANATDALNSGTVAMTPGGAYAASESQATISANVPGAILSEAPLFPTKKLINSDGGNAIYVTSCTKLADQVVQYCAWVDTNQDNYDLYVYGVNGTDYDLVNNRVATKTDWAGSFDGWMFKNQTYMRFTKDVPDSYIDFMKHWNDNATISPLLYFKFDATSVTDYYTACNNVKNQYSPTLELGVADVDTALKEMKDKLDAAGIDKLLAECQKQVDAYLAAHK